MRIMNKGDRSLTHQGGRKERKKISKVNNRISPNTTTNKGSDQHGRDTINMRNGLLPTQVALLMTPDTANASSIPKPNGEDQNNFSYVPHR